VVSLRGGDFLLECGQDLSIGYVDHDADVVRLYLEESFSFRVATAEAAVALAAVFVAVLLRRKKHTQRKYLNMQDSALW